MAGGTTHRDPSNYAHTAMTTQTTSPTSTATPSARSVIAWMASVNFEASALVPVWGLLTAYHEEQRHRRRIGPTLARLIGVEPTDTTRDPTGMDRWMQAHPGPVLRPVHPLAGYDDLPKYEEDGTRGWGIVTVAPERPGMTECANCGNPLEQAAKGRIRVTCSDPCRAALSRQRRAAKK